MNHSAGEIILARKEHISRAFNSAATLFVCVRRINRCLQNKRFFWRAMQANKVQVAMEEISPLITSAFMLFSMCEDTDHEKSDYCVLMTAYHDYVVKLQEYRPVLIQALSYNPLHDSFGRKYGAEMYDKISEGFMLPDIKQIGVKT